MFTDSEEIFEQKKNMLKKINLNQIQKNLIDFKVDHGIQIRKSPSKKRVDIKPPSWNQYQNLPKVNNNLNIFLDSLLICNSRIVITPEIPKMFVSSIQKIETFV